MFHLKVEEDSVKVCVTSSRLIFISVLSLSTRLHSKCLTLKSYTSTKNHEL